MNDGADGPKEPGLLNLGLVERFVGDYAIFDRVKSREGTYETKQLIRHPARFFRNNPLFTLAFTVPVMVVFMGAAVIGGVAPTSVDGMVDAPIWGRSSTSTCRCTSSEHRSRSSASGTCLPPERFRHSLVSCS